MGGVFFCEIFLKKSAQKVCRNEKYFVPLQPISKSADYGTSFWL